jgi:hypothetical protein
MLVRRTTRDTKTLSAYIGSDERQGLLQERATFANRGSIIALKPADDNHQSSASQGLSRNEFWQPVICKTTGSMVRK